ncbi:hypothetical protein [Mycobacterium intracellulare]|uniref:hypothetical protein n=1 Tax=Mycobacterium intracellulare TaxID=1767 RepID=UPI0013F4E983|nr:hypothetical protein [Mycobacterium intracellulare]
MNNVNHLIVTSINARHATIGKKRSPAGDAKRNGLTATDQRRDKQSRVNRSRPAQRTASTVGGPRPGAAAVSPVGGAGWSAYPAAPKLANAATDGVKAAAMNWSSWCVDESLSACAWSGGS